MSDLFYVFGIALCVMALVISFLGLRSQGFPASRGLFAAMIGLMGTLVVASAGFAVVLSREEAEGRSEELAAFEAEQAAEESEAPAEEPGTAPAETEPPIETEPAKAETLALTSPADGALTFGVDALEASAGEVALEYTNPSPVPHNVAIEGGGATIAQGATVSGGDAAAATASLEPGDYVFFCSIPGHREAGMEGTLTVK